MPQPLHRTSYPDPNKAHRVTKSPKGCSNFQGKLVTATVPRGKLRCQSNCWDYSQGTLIIERVPRLMLLLYWKRPNDVDHKPYSVSQVSAFQLFQLLYECTSSALKQRQAHSAFHQRWRISPAPSALAPRCSHIIRQIWWLKFPANQK